MTTLDQTSSDSCTGASPGATAAGGCGGGFLATHLAPFTDALGTLDRVLDAACTVDAKTDELIRFALSIKARSEPCVRKHFLGSLAAGASEAEIGYVFALTMREAAGADDCWTHGIISSLSIDSATDVEDEEATGCCG
jgi:alkylhydroperoxidase/carboxymuconolactone decarboxylase family protein YurZ